MRCPQASEGVGGISVLEGRLNANAIDDDALHMRQVRPGIRARVRLDGRIRVLAPGSGDEDAVGLGDLSHG